MCVVVHKMATAIQVSTTQLCFVMTILICIIMNTLKNVPNSVVMNMQNTRYCLLMNMPKSALDCFKSYSLQLVQNNHRGRYILEDSAHASSGLSSCVPPEPPEPPDTSTPDNGRAQWYLGFLHVMSGMANLIMTIPLQVKRNVGQWATKVRTCKIFIA